jgi:hypothetical protein
LTQDAAYRDSSCLADLSRCLMDVRRGAAHQVGVMVAARVHLHRSGMMERDVYLQIDQFQRWLGVLRAVMLQVGAKGAVRGHLHWNETLEPGEQRPVELYFSRKVYYWIGMCQYLFGIVQRVVNRVLHLRRIGVGGAVLAYRAHFQAQRFLQR